MSRIEPTTFPALALWERQDLEAWVTSTPELAGGDFTVVTSEFDRFDRTSERLDVLGIVPLEPGRARLVVVELKRDGSSTTVDLQAIKYAAYVAAAQFADVVDMYASHHGISHDEARALLFELLGGSDDEVPVIDDTPRIVLVAGDFRAEVTTTVLWLVDNFDVDIRCVRLQPFEVDKRILVHSEVIIPLPEAEQYRLGVQRKRREVGRGEERKARAGRSIPRLLDAGALAIGQTLYFRRDAVPKDAPTWSPDNPLYRATLITGEGVNTFEWTDPESKESLRQSPSLLAATLLHRLGLRAGELNSAGVNGMHYWTVDGETSLRDVAAEAGLIDRSTRRIDHDALRNVCEKIPEGYWITYSDLAEAIGVPGAAQSVATAIATNAEVSNPHRVLRAPGRVAAGWRTSDGGGPDLARKRLEEEGVTFTAADVADSARHWIVPGITS